METLCSAMEHLLAQWPPIAAPWDSSQLGVRHVHASQALGGLEWTHLVNVSILVTMHITVTFCPQVITFLAKNFNLQMALFVNLVAKEAVIFRLCVKLSCTCFISLIDLLLQ